MKRAVLQKAIAIEKEITSLEKQNRVLEKLQGEPRTVLTASLTDGDHIVEIDITHTSVVAVLEREVQANDYRISQLNQELENL